MIVVVVGMHRSGTSALSGILHMNGIAMGGRWSLFPRPRPENPRGYYENVLFRGVNDLALRRRGYETKSYDPVVPQVECDRFDRAAMSAMIRHHRRRFSSWGFKDPRTCLTLGGWLRTIEDLGLASKTKLVFVSRAAHAVARSLHAREPGVAFERFLALWVSYTDAGLRAVDESGWAPYYVSYERLCDDPVATSRRLFDYLGAPLDDASVERFFDRGLNRSGRSDARDVTDAALENRIRRLTDELERRLADASDAA